MTTVIVLSEQQLKERLTINEALEKSSQSLHFAISTEAYLQASLMNLINSLKLKDYDNSDYDNSIDVLKAIGKMSEKIVSQIRDGKDNIHALQQFIEEFECSIATENKPFNQINVKTLELSKKLEEEKFVRIGYFNCGDKWRDIAKELIDEITLGAFDKYEVQICFTHQPTTHVYFVLLKKDV